MTWHSETHGHVPLRQLAADRPEDLSESLSYWISRVVGYAALGTVLAVGLVKLFF